MQFRTVLLTIVLAALLFAILQLIEFIIHLLSRKNLESFAKRKSLKFHRGKFRVFGWGDSHLIRGIYKGWMITTDHSDLRFVPVLPPAFYTTIELAGRLRTNARASFRNRSFLDIRHKPYKMGDKKFENKIIVSSSPKDFARSLLLDEKIRAAIRALVFPKLLQSSELVITRTGNLRFHGDHIIKSSKLEFWLNHLCEIAEGVEATLIEDIEDTP